MIIGNRQKYKIILEQNSLFIIASLLVVLSLLIFYLGLSLGKGVKTIDSSLLPVFNSKESAKNDDALLVINNDNKSVADYEKKLNNLDSSIALPSFNSSKSIEANLDSKDHTNTAVEKETTPPMDAPTAPKTAAADNMDAKDQKYTIQVAATNKSENANQLLKKLRSENYDAYILSEPTKNGELQYKIRVGSGLDKIEMEKQLAQLTKKFSGVTVPSVHSYIRSLN